MRIYLETERLNRACPFSKRCNLPGELAPYLRPCVSSAVTLIDMRGERAPGPRNVSAFSK